MVEETREDIEMRVLEDIQYILNYEPRAIGAESALYFSKMNIIKPIAVNAYPNIYSDIVQRFERDEAYRRLKMLGLREAKFLYTSLPNYLKKPQKFTEIFREVAQSHLSSTLIFKDKVKEDKKLKGFKIRVEKCFFCSEVTVFEDIDIPYCIPNAGVYENMYNIKSLYNEEGRDPRLIRIDAIKSAKFDGDFCEYQVVVLD
ncbi:MAG: hypothetical protein HWN65_08160 [Candidatus Helarchaeota archaeon]|nr:hypothetical protein [Candidatus Helarchaeota archaeon]